MSENEKTPPTSSGPGEPGRVATENGKAALPTDGAPAAPSEPTEDRTRPVEGNGASAADATSSAGSDTGAAGSGAVPASNGTPANGVPSGSDDATAVLHRGPSPFPRPRPEAAETTHAVVQPGSVPTPPPWRRAPGDEVPPEPVDRPAKPAPQRSPAVDSLMSEAPTAYIDRGRAPVASGVLTEDPAREQHAEVPSVAAPAPRQALLQVKRFDPWSVLKLALVLAMVLFLIWMVAVGVLYGVLAGMGVWDRLNGTYADLVSGGQSTGGSLISAGNVFGFAAVIGAINSLLFAVAMTVGAFVYNVSADLVGGVEVTLSERD